MVKIKSSRLILLFSQVYIVVDEYTKSKKSSLLAWQDDKVVVQSKLKEYYLLVSIIENFEEFST